MKIRNNQEFNLYDAIKWTAKKFGLTGEWVQNAQEDNYLKDWEILANYQRIQEVQTETNRIILKEYDQFILNRFNYDVKIVPWLEENISQEVMNKAKIGYYPGGKQITIPHYDPNDRFIGLRGRALSEDDIKLYGKYRPIKIHKVLYSHPLGMNLYGLNWSKNAINAIKKAIVFESEKSVLKFASYFGWENNISVACCGSNLSAYQIQLLLEQGTEEIIVAFDRQFQEIGDSEFQRLKNNLIKLYNKYNNTVKITFIFDSKKITGYKDAPIDCDKDIFLKLFRERICL